MNSLYSEKAKVGRFSVQVKKSALNYRIASIRDYARAQKKKGLEEKAGPFTR